MGDLFDLSPNFGVNLKLLYKFFFLKWLETEFYHIKETNIPLQIG